jgi:hypothetical protein
MLSGSDPTPAAAGGAAARNDGRFKRKHDDNLQNSLRTISSGVEKLRRSIQNKNYDALSAKEICDQDEVSARLLIELVCQGSTKEIMKTTYGIELNGVKKGLDRTRITVLYGATYSPLFQQGKPDNLDLFSSAWNNAVEGLCPSRSFSSIVSSPPPDNKKNKVQCDDGADAKVPADEDDNDQHAEGSERTLHPSMGKDTLSEYLQRSWSREEELRARVEAMDAKEKQLEESIRAQTREILSLQKTVESLRDVEKVLESTDRMMNARTTRARNAQLEPVSRVIVPPPSLNLYIPHHTMCLCLLMS